MLLGEVLRLREVVGEVVELDRVGVGIPARAEVRGAPRDRAATGCAAAAREPPAVLVHRPVPDRLEVLLRVALGRIGSGERVSEREPMHRLLLDPVDVRRGGDARELEHRRGDVDHVREVPAHEPGIGDPVRIVDDERIPGPAEVGGDLLAPVERQLLAHAQADE